MSVSDVVDLKLSVSSGDVVGGEVLDEKNVNTESGNPYGVFVQTARDELGSDPSRITVDAAAVTVDTTSNNVTTLGGVYVGLTRVSFIMNSATGTFGFSVATRDVLAADGAGPVDFDVDFDSATLSPMVFSDLASGSFKVQISGPAADSFEAGNADADLTISLTFSAFK